jgi:hypothetical protein
MLTEATPVGDGWERIPWRGAPPVVNSSHYSAWQRGSCCVISSIELAELPSGKGDGWQWQISVSNRRERPDEKQVRRALIAFDMVGAEEDNHHPGIARHFFMPVDPSERRDCQCKTTEATIVEPDGYVWTNPKPETGEGCRGCEISVMTRRPCPIHYAATEARP